MAYQRTAAIVLRQMYLLRESPARVLPLFIWVAIDIVLWGFITKYLNSVSGSGFNFVSAMLGAVLLWDFSTRVIHGVTTAFLEDVWSRNFLNIFSTPLSISEYILGLVLTSVGTSAIGLIVMLLVASGVFGLSFFSYGIMFIPFLFLLFLFGIAIGIVGSAIVLRYGPASEWFVWPLPAMLSPFVGVFYPIATLPPWMQFVSHFLPPAYVFEGMRSLVQGQTVEVSRLAIGGSLACFYIALACLIFRGVYRHSVKTGLIARYSAESLS